MASKKGKKAQRTPADKLILDFLNLHEIVLIADEISIVEGVAENKIYTVNKKIRIRAYFSDQLDEILKKAEPKNGEEVSVEK